MLEAFNKPGNFLSRNGKPNLSDCLLSDIDSAMLPLIKPWDSGHGIMMSYDSTPEIDIHFLAKSYELVNEWREEAGVHPSIKFGEITGGDLSIIVLFLVSFYLKHVHFASLASKNFPEILIPQSLTIWGPLEDLKKDLAEYLGMNERVVANVFDAIKMKPEDSKHLNNFTSKFMPLIIDLGNGIILKPISSITRNPFFSIISLLELRNPYFRNCISNPREEWLRSSLYSLFAGARYHCVSGNIKLSIDNSVITDIDAVVYDYLTGELALFQIKWQDFFFNDVKKLRSKASNLIHELDNWADKITNWIEINSIEKLSKSLRLKLPKDKSISSIYLFGISKNAARMQGYGFRIKTKNLAIANWPQFVRNRFEIGPAERVFHKLYNSLKAQENGSVKTKALPVKFFISDKIMVFEDLWSTTID